MARHRARRSRRDLFAEPRGVRPEERFSEPSAEMPGKGLRSAPVSARSVVRSAAARHAVPGIVIKRRPEWLPTEIGEARNEPQAHARAAGARARRLRAAIPSAAPDLAAPPQAVAPEAPNPPPSASEAQVAPGRWDVDRVRSSDLLGAADDDRAAAAMFYYGYLAAKAGIHVIDVGKIDENVGKVMKQCAATPNLTVPLAFRQVLRPRRSAG